MSSYCLIKLTYFRCIILSKTVFPLSSRYCSTLKSYSFITYIIHLDLLQDPLLPNCPYLALSIIWRSSTDHANLVSETLPDGCHFNFNNDQVVKYACPEVAKDTSECFDQPIWDLNTETHHTLCIGCTPKLLCTQMRW